LIEFVTATAAESTIRVLDRVFTTFGIPKEIKTDNGPPFNGTKFSEFAETQGFNIVRSRLSGQRQMGTSKE
jgi:hypothetical protein